MTAARWLRSGGGLLLAAPLWAWWIAGGGGFASTQLLPGVAYLGACVALALVAGPRVPVRGAPLAALVALTALTAWTAASVLWASDRGAAWLEAERAALLLASFALPLLWPPGRGAVLAALGVVVVSCAVGLADGLRQAASDPDALGDGRLTAPTGYPNATAALAVMGALPALLLASRREASALLRAAALGTAGALAAAGLLTQSRGMVAVAAVAIVALALVVPGRLRLLSAAALVGAVVVLVRDPLLDLRLARLFGGTPLDEAVQRATGAILVAAGALALVAMAWAALDAVVPERAPRPRAGRRVRAVATAVAALTVAGVAVGAAVDGRAGAWAQARVDDFRTPDYARVESGRTRFDGGLGSNRYDYWRVAAGELARRPLQGAGAGSFAQTYFRERRTDKAPQYAHSVWLGAAAELGAPGLALLAAFATAALAAAGRAVRAAAPRDRLVRAAAAAPLLVLLLHASADWTHAYAGLAAPALGLAAAAAVPWGAERRQVARAAASGPAGATTGHGRGRGRRHVGVAARAGGVLVALAVAVSALPLLAAERLTTRAQETVRVRPAEALEDARRAAVLAPLSPRPALVEGLLALELRDLPRARERFAEAVRRDPGAWFPRVELALLERRRDRARALALLAGAAAANPREALVREARRAVLRGGPPGPRAAARRALAKRG